MNAPRRPRSPGRGLAMLLAALSLLLYSPVVRASRATGNEAVPGELRVDPPTLHCLGFRWPLSGDDNGNASVAVSFRRATEKGWRDALPLMRLHRETVDPTGAAFTCGNLFAGSLLGLAPDTEYEVRLRLTDPDGGSAERLVKSRTRPIPPVIPGDRQLHVYPAEYAGPRKELSAATLADAARLAQPGDVVVLHAGTHAGPLLVARSGTPDRPVVFRGEGDAVIRGPGPSGNVVDVSGKDHITIEKLVLTRGRTGIKANACKGLVVRGCRIENVSSGIATFSADAAGWYIADNEITGSVKSWYPRTESSDTGISCAGRGHVIAHNRVRRFWDCISTQNYGPPKLEWATAVDPPQVAIDIFGNDCSEALDDGIEADGGLHNIRVFENRIFNVHVGLSAQPNLGGPLYLLRNVVYNTTYSPLKLHNGSTGLLVYHNLLISAGPAFASWPPAWQNSTFRNNLFLGTARYAMETGSADRRTSLDYNGYARSHGSELLVRWSADEGKTWGRHASLEEFARATGHERHGKEIGFDLFEKAATPREGSMYSTSDLDPRLRPGASAIDAGCRLPTVNDGFSGAAPDLGPYERGGPLPHYGPRGSKVVTSVHLRHHRFQVFERE